MTGNVSDVQINLYRQGGEKMNHLLLIRGEIVCIVIIVFVMFTSRLYNIGKDSKIFGRILTYALLHTLFDLLTVITVNDPRTQDSFSLPDVFRSGFEVCPFEIFNWVSHIIFYMLAMLFVHEFLSYIIERCYSKTVLRNARIVSTVIQCVLLIILPFLRMDFIPCSGTRSSFGPAAFLAYGLAMVYLMLCLLIVIINRRRLEMHVKLALVPMLIIAMVVEILQVFIPELLFTGSTLTIISVGFFFSLENPTEVFRRKEQIDALTGVKTRNMYEQGLAAMEQDRGSGTVFTFVFSDINDLKFVNDMYGHLEGDRYITTVAQILNSCLEHCEDIYRMGGDEFMAVYRNCGEQTVRKEIDAVIAACAESSEGAPYVRSLAVGYASSGKNDENLKSVLRSADYKMYSKKIEMKKQSSYSLTGEGPSVSGLTDRIFDALSDTDSDTFIYVLNTATDVCRMSKLAVRYFGMEGEFMTDFLKWWETRLHPDDREEVVGDLQNCIMHVGCNHDKTYRVKNAGGRYVTINCKGRVLHGKNGEPDLFAGRMTLLADEKSTVPV